MCHNLTLLLISMLFASWFLPGNNNAAITLFFSIIQNSLNNVTNVFSFQVRYNSAAKALWPVFFVFVFFNQNSQLFWNILMANDIFKFSISSRINVVSLRLIQKLSISYKLSNLLWQTFTQCSFMILFISFILNSCSFP